MTRKHPMTLQLQQQWRKDGETNQSTAGDDQPTSGTPKTADSEQTTNH